MARSEVHSGTPLTSVLPDTWLQTASAKGERRVRRISAWLLLIFLLQGELGAVWDREWHAFIGRDQFWTPPHTLIYSCVSGAGLLALGIVLTETLRYFRHTPGVNDHSTVPILYYFHAPLGFSVLGFGALLALAAAPLDNYWHQLYGIDIALWAPFHMMGVTGGMIGILGMVYIFASEASTQRQSQSTPHRYLGLTVLEIGTIMALASFMNYVLTGFLQFPLVSIGTIHISTYPLPLVTGGIVCMIAAVRFTRKPGVAMLFTALLVLHTLVVELFVPWAIRVAAQEQGLAYRIPGHIPFFQLDYALLPLLFLIPALIVDGYAYKRFREQKENNHKSVVESAILGAIIALPAVLVAPFILKSYSSFAPIFLPEPGIAVQPLQMALVILISGLIILLAGAAGGLLGADLGDIWRWNTR